MSTAYIAILGGLALAVGPLWRWVGGYLVTIAHEAGHAVVTILCSGRVTGIRLHTRGSAARSGLAGVTYARTTVRARVPVSLAGYPAPAVVGLVTLALLHADRTRGALAAMVAALVVMLVLIRNVFGAVLLLAVGGALYGAVLYGTPTAHATVAGVLSWALLFGTTRDTLSTFRHGSGDAASLATLTNVPTKAWSALFVLATVAATGFAAWLTLTAWAGGQP